MVIGCSTDRMMSCRHGDAKLYEAICREELEGGSPYEANYQTGRWAYTEDLRGTVRGVRDMNNRVRTHINYWRIDLSSG